VIFPPLSNVELAQWREPRIFTLFFLGFSAGLPILLIFSTLSLWLGEAGVSKSAVTYFSWAALGYSFKFVWAPLVDKLPVPVLGRSLGRRRSWLLLSQIAIALSIILMALTDPVHSLQGMAIAAVMLGFSSATQDIVIDAFRIECADEKFQALLSSSYIAGYRIGMVAAGAGSLYLAEEFGSTADAYSYEAWRQAYFCMAALVGIGLLTTLLCTEPDQTRSAAYPHSSGDYIRFVLLFAVSVSGFIAVFLWWPELADSSGRLQQFGSNTLNLLVALGVAVGLAMIGRQTGLVNRDMVADGYVRPVQDFLKRYGKLAVWVLLLVGFYRVSDIVMGVIANVFYQDIGFSKKEIAAIAKFFGLIMTIAGSFAGGFLVLRFGVLRVLIVGVVLSASSNLLFMWLAASDPTIAGLKMVIAADNFSAGLAVAAFIAWLSSLTSISFTAVQYAIFSSVMTLFPKLLSGYSGTVVESVGYQTFFLFTALISVPIVALIIYVGKHTSHSDPAADEAK
jgi:PAT family beta-lactamase induction signal transducer AmpG